MAVQRQCKNGLYHSHLTLIRIQPINQRPNCNSHKEVDQCKDDQINKVKYAILAFVILIIIQLTSGNTTAFCSRLKYGSYCHKRNTGFHCIQEAHKEVTQASSEDWRNNKKCLKITQKVITIPNITGNATINIKIWCQIKADLSSFWKVNL